MTSYKNRFDELLVYYEKLLIEHTRLKEEYERVSQTVNEDTLTFQNEVDPKLQEFILRNHLQLSADLAKAKRIIKEGMLESFKNRVGYYD